MLETLIAMLILGILVGLAAPSFVDLVERNRIKSAANELVVGLGIARQVAISRGTTTFICHSNEINDANPTCNGGTDSDWQKGILIYVAPPTSFNPSLRAYDNSSDDLVEQANITSGNSIVVTNTNAQNYIGFTAEGLLFDASGITFTVCSSRLTLEEGRFIRISSAGRISSETAKGANACS